MRSDEETLAALRRGDERVFVELVEQHQSLMLHVASRYVGNRTVAEEVVQETWLGVVAGIARFEGRSSLKTWIFRILANRAITRAERERRTLPFSSLEDEGADEPAVDAGRFRPEGDRWPGHWQCSPDPLPEHRLLERETLAMIDAAIAELPERQHLVIVMRDIEGWSAEEVCQALAISEGNQRVLLHRARSKIRSCLESYLDPALALT
jgi:RNA polymerase sigma-70 factor (ECF subfamily)